jgi:hypothetical protein
VTKANIAKIEPSDGLEHLRPETRAWVDEIEDGWALDARHRILLVTAAEAYDRFSAAREFLDEHGTTYLDRFEAPRLRPEVTVERDARLAFSRLVAQLELSDDVPLAGPLALRPRRKGHR